jgi:TPR repeat protein
MSDLGVLYENGKGVAQDYAEAVAGTKKRRTLAMLSA